MKLTLKILTFYFFVLICNNVAYTQPNWCWADDALANGDEEFLDLETEATTGNSYAVGYFNGDISVDFPFGLNGTPDMSSTIGNQDGLVAKYDQSGSVIWAFKIGNAGDNVWITGVEVGAGGNIFITGYFNNNCNFQGVTGSSSTTLAGVGDDVFLASYDSDGFLLWVISGSSTGEDRGMDIVVNNTNVYITGWFENTITFGNGGTPTAAIDARDSYVVCYDQATGNLQWESFAGDIDVGFSVNDRGLGIAADNNGVYITGTFERTIQFNGGPTQLVALSPGNRNIFIAEYNASVGSIVWAEQISATAGSGNCEARALAVDGNNLYVAGGIEGNVSVPGGGPVVLVPGTGEEIFACAINRTTKITQWVEVAENNNNNPVIAEDVITDGLGNIYVTGFFRQVTQFNGGLDVKISGGNGDCFVMAMDDIGTYLWTNIGADNSVVIGKGLGLDNSGGIYVAGMMENQATFGTLPVLADAGGDDAFIAKINCVVCAPSITQCENDTTITAGPTCTIVLGDFTGGVTAIDGCSAGLTITQNPIPGTIIPTGVDTVWMYVTDGNGNIDSCSFQLTVTANVNPTIVSCGDWLQNETTVGQTDNENNFSCVGFPTPGEDVYYQITVPAGNYWLQFNLDSVVDANDTRVETFWIGGSCPLGGGCISSNWYDISSQQFSTGGNSLQYLATGPGTYYFVVDAQVDGIDSYNLGFYCLDSGIEFDTSTTCGDPNNDGIIPYVNGSPVLNTQTCQSVTICHDLYIANYQDFEWIDSVYMDLGPCYTNVVPTTVAGFYSAGNWVGTYNAVSSSISWQFNNTGNPNWGDGTGGNYACDLGKTRLYNLCFTADISSTCAADSNLNIGILIADDAVGSGGGTVAGFDYVLSDDFIINNPLPTITCPANIVVNNDPGNCSAQVTGIGPTTSGDNCPNPFITYSLTGSTLGAGNNDASGVAFNLGITTVQYLISDSAGGKDSCQFTVTVIDNEAPLISCPSNTSVNVGVGTCSSQVIGIAPIVSDNCVIDSVSFITTGATTLSGLNDASGNVFNVGQTQVIYSVVDTAGNVDTCSFLVEVLDLIAPTITCPTNVNLTCPAIVNGIAPVAIGDNCVIDSVNYVITGSTIGSGLNDASGTLFNSGVSTVTYTITDLSGNTTSCFFTVSVIDNVNPTITCPANIILTCPGIVNTVAPIATGDNCAIDSVNYVITGATIGSGLNDASGTFFNPGISTITYTVTDLSGNTTSCFFNITVNDIIFPTISCPGNLNAFTTALSCDAIINGIAPVAFGDNCTVDSVAYILTGATIGTGNGDASGLNYNVGTTTVTYVVYDLSGNLDSCNFTITVVDNINPTIGCPSNLIQGTDPGLCSAIVLGIAPILPNDNCTIDSVGYILTGATTGTGNGDASGLTFNVGVTTVSYIIYDLSGNVDSCNFTVTINDTQGPSITCPVSTNFNTDPGLCTAVINGLNPTGLGDNCVIDSVAYVLSGATTGTGNGDPSGLAFNQGITNIAYTIYDMAGNSASCNTTITVVDNENPTITCSPNTVVNNDVGLCSALVNGIAPTTVGDNCSIDSVEYLLTGATIGAGNGDASGTVFNLGTTIVTYVVYDLSGNLDSCNFSVTVNDTEAPIISCPGNDTVYVPAANCAAIVNGIAPVGVNENCVIDSVSYTLSGATTGAGLNDASGNSFNTGSTVVFYQVFDLAGNKDTCSFIVTVLDTIPPSISCPGNVNTNNDSGLCSAVVNGIAPINPNDNCAIDTVYYILSGATTGSGLNDASGINFNIGNTLVSYYVIDLSGNMDSCNFTVTIVDNENPMISCPSNIVVGNDVGSCSATVNGIAPISFSDNCLVDSVSYTLSGSTIGTGLTDASGLIFNVGVTNVTYVVYDSSGNLDSCNFTITVNDTENPVITCPSNIVVCDTNVTAPIPIFSDNCSTPTISNDYNLTNDASGIYPYGVTTVNWVVTDTSGNIGGCTMTIEVEVSPVSYAGEDQILFGTNSTNFEADIPLIGTGNWVGIAGFGNVANTSDPHSFVDALEPGINIFEWTVTNGTCPEARDEVIINILPLIIPNGFSPNDDGENDFFEILGIELLENEVIIFNRWGVELYAKKNYQNDWGGTGANGQSLPEDTYYYIVKIPQFEKELSGFVVLKR